MTKVYSVRLDTETRHKLAELARVGYRNASDEMRRLIHEAYKELQKRTPRMEVPKDE